jgi:hypothetical protein
MLILLSTFLLATVNGVLAQTEASDTLPVVQLRHQDAPLSRKLLRSELIGLGAQGATTGLLLFLPRDFTRWSLDSAAYQFSYAWTKPPVFDHDSWTFNYVAHPYAGAFMYNTMRCQGAKPLPSFLFATSQSLIWEFLIESWFERPSIQDLIITSNLGSLLGEGIHQATIRMKRNGFSTMEKVFVIVFNPAFCINNGMK